MQRLVFGYTYMFTENKTEAAGVRGWVSDLDLRAGTIYGVYAGERGKSNILKKRTTK
jgi:hypothetical protein